MWEFIRDFFMHKDAFLGYMRGGLLAVGAMGLVGVPDTPEKWMAVGAIFGAGMIRAGEKNPVEGQ